MASINDWLSEESVLTLRNSEEYALAALLADLIIGKKERGEEFSLVKAIRLLICPDFWGPDGIHAQTLMDVEQAVRDAMRR